MVGAIANGIYIRYISLLKAINNNTIVNGNARVLGQFGFYDDANACQDQIGFQNCTVI